MIKKGDLVKILNDHSHKDAVLVVTDPYCTVFTPEDRSGILPPDALLSSEVIVVDVLVKDFVEKKVPISSLKKVR